MTRDSHQLTSCNYKPLTRSSIKKLRFKVQSTCACVWRVSSNLYKGGDEKQEKTWYGLIWYGLIPRAYKEKRACNSPQAKTLWAEECYWKSTVISNRVFVQSTGSR